MEAANPWSSLDPIRKSIEGEILHSIEDIRNSNMPIENIRPWPLKLPISANKVTSPTYVIKYEVITHSVWLSEIVKYSLIAGRDTLVILMFNEIIITPRQTVNNTIHLLFGLSLILLSTINNTFSINVM